MPAFDGLRGFAVMTVIVIHALPERIESLSWVLDLFFMLSSFLITTLMIQECRGSGGVSLRRFYAKRAWRLLPTLYAALALATVLAAVAFSTADGDLEGFTFGGFITREILPAGLYVYNIVNPLGYPNPGVALFQMWSLSLEEQWYLVGGLLLATMVTRRRLVAGALAMAAVAVAIQTARATGHLGPINFWLQRPDALLVGVVAAVINNRIPDPLPDVAARWLRATAWIGLAAIAVVSLGSIAWLEPTGFYLPYLPEIPEGLSDAEILERAREAVRTEALWIRWGFTVVHWSLVPVLIALARLPRFWVGSVVSVRPLRFVGTMSYSLYLIHTIPILLFVGPIPLANAPLRAVVALVSSFVFALPLYYVVERRSMRRKARLNQPDPDPDPRTAVP